MSDTSGQDGGGGGDNGIFGNPTFQKLLQTTIGLVAQLHGGQAPNALGQVGAPQGGQPQGGMATGLTPGAALSGMQPQQGAGAPPQGGQPQGGPAGLAPAPNMSNALPSQGGGAPAQGQGSAPPSGSGGQRVFPQAQMGQPLGAPQVPQGGMQPGQGGMQPGQGGGNFAQAPWMAGPLNDYAAFSKANPMPKAPTFEDAIDVAEKLRQGTVGGSMQPGAGGGIGTSPGLVDAVMEKMNAQYKNQLEAHTGAWTGQVAAGHAHNQEMAERERARHDQATEKNMADAISGKGVAAAASTAQKAEASGNKHDEALAKIQQGAERLAALHEQINNTKDAAQQKALQAQINEEEKQQRSAATNYVNLLNGNNADTPEAKAEAEKLKAKQDGGGKQYPTPDASHIKMLKDGTGTPEQFDEAFGPGASKKYQ